MTPRARPATSVARRLTTAALLMPFAACADDAGTAPDDHDDGFAEIVLDAEAGWAFLDLGAPASEVTVADPRSSSAWDMAFLATSVMVNGGDAGPAGVEATCLCWNATLGDAAVMALTAASGAADFEAVTAADVPADPEAWVVDELVPAVDGWYSYDVQTHAVSADPAAVFKVRTAGGEGYAKLHVVAIAGAAQAHPGTVTLEFAVQAGAGAPFGETRTLQVDASGGPVAVDLETAATVTPGAPGWDLLVDGWSIRVNGGVSGNGGAGAVGVEDAFEAVADAGDMTAGHYRGDTYGGVFASGEAGRRWYRYDLQGNHQIWPTYNVYLVRRGDEVYKVQIVGYYHPDTGDARHITVRYALLGQ